MTADKRGRSFTYRDLKRLEKNPFIDKEMLRFIRENRQRERRGRVALRESFAGHEGKAQNGESGRSHAQHSAEKKLVLDEKIIRLLTDAIKSMLRG